MKNLFKSILCVVATAVAFTSCSNVDDSLAPSGDNGVYVNMLAGVDGEDGTRAAIIVGDKTFSGNWETTDQLGVYYTTPAAANDYAAFVYDEASKSFGGTLSSSAHGNWKYNAYYPHVEGMTDSNAKVPFGSGRWQTGNDYNSAYDVMVSEVVECADADAGKTPTGDPVKFKMSRLTSILCFSLSTTDADVAGAKVKSVKITSNTPISAKSLDFDFAASVTSAQLNALSQSNSILLSYTEGAEPSVADFKAFFNILPGNYSLKVDVLTDNNKMSSFNVDRTDASKPFEAGKLYTKTQTLTAWATPTFKAPTAVWTDHDWNTRYELVEGLPVNVEITADAGIQKFEIDITSAPLVEGGLLAAVGLSSHMDLVNPTPESEGMLKALGFPLGDEIRNSTNMSLDITALMGMLYAVCDGTEPPVTDNHDFKLTVTDNAGQAVANTVQLEFVARQLRVGNDVDLWKNTATINVKTFDPATPIENIAVEYKRSTEAQWQQAAISAGEFYGTFVASIAPTWTTSTNDAGLTISNVNRNTGIFADATYDVRLMISGVSSETITISTDKGDVIPGGDMEDSSLSCFSIINTNSTFWGSGNNNYMSIAALSKLCNQDVFTGMGGLKCAKLANQWAFIMMAAGNLFTGTFVKPSTQGTVAFGQPYEYTARPTAMKVKYHSTLGTIDAVKWPGEGVPAKGDPDQARIFVAIVDWSERHEVSSGLAAPSGMWDPCKVSSLTAGKIIGYGSLTVPSSTEGNSMVEATLDIHYYDNVTKPTGKYSIVISCSASAFGDYMVGYKKSVMYVDDFEWVY